MFCGYNGAHSKEDDVGRIRAFLGLAVLLAARGQLSFAQKKSTAEQLGYPADSKLLIIHADDVGLSHSVS